MFAFLQWKQTVLESVFNQEAQTSAAQDILNAAVETIIPVREQFITHFYSVFKYNTFVINIYIYNIDQQETYNKYSTHHVISTQRLVGILVKIFWF